MMGKVEKIMKQSLTRVEAISILTLSVDELQTLAGEIEGTLWSLRSSESEIQRLTTQIAESARQIRLESIRISERILEVAKAS